MAAGVGDDALIAPAPDSHSLLDAQDLSMSGTGSSVVRLDSGVWASGETAPSGAPAVDA